MGKTFWILQKNRVVRISFIPVLASCFNTRRWETVTKTALSSRRMRMVRRPTSDVRSRSLLILTRAVSVLLNGNQTELADRGY